GVPAGIPAIGRARGLTRHIAAIVRGPRRAQPAGTRRHAIPPACGDWPDSIARCRKGQCRASRADRKMAPLLSPCEVRHAFHPPRPARDRRAERVLRRPAAHRVSRPPPQPGQHHRRHGRRARPRRPGGRGPGHHPGRGREGGMSALPTPPPGRSLAGTYLRMLGVTAIWAVTFHVGHYTAQHADPLGVALLRFLFAGLTLAGIAVLRGQSLRITRAQLPLVLALAIPGVVAYTLFFLASVQSISGTRAALITAGSR